MEYSLKDLKTIAEDHGLEFQKNAPMYKIKALLQENGIMNFPEEDYSVTPEDQQVEDHLLSSMNQREREFTEQMTQEERLAMLRYMKDISFKRSLADYRREAKKITKVQIKSNDKNTKQLDELFCCFFNDGLGEPLSQTCYINSVGNEGTIVYQPIKDMLEDFVFFDKNITYGDRSLNSRGRVQANSHLERKPRKKYSVTVLS